jgi:hypothetical protein
VNYTIRLLTIDNQSHSILRFFPHPNPNPKSCPKSKPYPMDPNAQLVIDELVKLVLEEL